MYGAGGSGALALGLALLLDGPCPRLPTDALVDAACPPLLFAFTMNLFACLS